MATYDLLTTTPAKIATGDILNCPYSGTYKQIELPEGKYKLEVWGAKGGYRSSSSYGGEGGYSVGTLELKAKTTVYLYAGGSGISGGTSGGWNGGGSRDTYPGGGGGSDIRINNTSLYARVIVAGGGGSDGSSSSNGGAGGGTNGVDHGTSGHGSGGQGGTQTGGGAGYSSDTSTAGTFGKGGTGPFRKNGFGGAGGGGWYGGAGIYPDGSADDDYGGGGGSGYVYTADTAANYPTGCLLNSDYYLTDAQTITGGSSTKPAQPLNTEDGYCRITVVAISFNGGVYIGDTQFVEQTTQGNIIPTEWTEVTEGIEYIAVNNEAKLTANGYRDVGDHGACKAVDNDSTTSWSSSYSEFIKTLKIEFAVPQKITKININASFSSGDDNVLIRLRGSNDGQSWTELFGDTSLASVQNPIVLSNVDWFKFYELWAIPSLTGTLFVYNFKTSEYIAKVSQDMAKKVKAMYVGVDGMAREVKKGYIGVNGVARQFYEAVTPIRTLSYRDRIGGTPLKIKVQKGTTTLLDESVGGQIVGELITRQIPVGATVTAQNAYMKPENVITNTSGTDYQGILPSTLARTQITEGDNFLGTYTYQFIMPDEDVTIQAQGPGCFVAGTQVLMEDNSLKNIEDIKCGDRVQCCDLQNNSLVCETVLNTFKRENADVIKIVTNDSEFISTTTHNIYSIDRETYVPANALNIGETLKTSTGIATVKQIIPLTEKQAVYNFTVAKYHNYFISSQRILVHNAFS